MANKNAVLPDLSRYMEGRKRHFITYFEGTEGMLPSEKAKLYKKMYGAMKLAGKVQLDGGGRESFKEKDQ